MIKVVILGSGNVAGFLFEAFHASKNVKVVQLYNHSASSLSRFEGMVPVTTSLEDLADADVYLISVKDDAISEIAEMMGAKKALVVHSSGAVPIDHLANQERRGVFYPLQTFSRNREIVNKEVPFCLEVNNPEDMTLLKQMTSEISGIPFEVSSEKRKKIHLAAVFVCNFVNHLYAIGEDICRENDLPFEILQPLIRETAEKISDTSPFENQTGPAIRKDQSTINAHLELINSEENKEIYQLLTRAIQTTHGKKL